MTDGLCVLCPGQRTATHGHICEQHLQRLSTWLHEIETETALLSTVPSMAQPQGARGGTLASHRAPARLDVLVLTDPRTAAGDDGTLGVLGVLGSWARVVREDRALAWPERVTVVSERKTLTAALDWIAGQAWIDEFARELRQLRQQLKVANGTYDDPPAGWCFLPDEGRRCDGPIWVDDVNGHAHCGRCGATWDGHELHRLALILEQDEAEAARPHTDDGRPMLTAAELAEREGVTVNAIRIRLSRAGVKAVGSYYDPAALDSVSA